MFPWFHSLHKSTVFIKNENHSLARNQRWKVTLILWKQHEIILSIFSPKYFVSFYGFVFCLSFVLFLFPDIWSSLAPIWTLRFLTFHAIRELYTNWPVEDKWHFLWLNIFPLSWKMEFLPYFLVKIYPR